MYVNGVSGQPTRSGQAEKVPQHRHFFVIYRIHVNAMYIAFRLWGVVVGFRLIILYSTSILH